MKKLTGVVSLFGAFYMYCLLIIENFAYQAGAISSDEWRCKCLMLLMCGIISWLSLNNTSCPDKDTERDKTKFG